MRAPVKNVIPPPPAAHPPVRYVYFDINYDINRKEMKGVDGVPPQVNLKRSSSQSIILPCKCLWPRYQWILSRLGNPDLWTWLGLSSL